MNVGAFITYALSFNLAAEWAALSVGEIAEATINPSSKLPHADLTQP
jgi:hypothetical protein